MAAEGQSDKMASDIEVPVKQSETLAECLWTLNSGCEHGKAVGGVFQQWQVQLERKAMFQVAIQFFTSIACRLLFITGENA